MKQFLFAIILVILFYTATLGLQNALIKRSKHYQDLNRFDKIENILTQPVTYGQVSNL